MSRRNESFAEILVKMPWRINVVLGVFAFVALRWGVPAVWDDKYRGLAMAAEKSAPLAALAFGAIACLSFFLEKKHKSLVDRQTSLESLRAVSWKDFELLVAEAYRRQGYQVDYSLRKGADGGVDLVLRKAGRTSLVQCKQWKAYSVGAPVIREQFGIMTAEKADEVIVVTSGKFTLEAVNFALGKPIQLVDGPRLLELVKFGQRHPLVSNGHRPSASQKALPPLCPKCSKAMILRTARRGQNTGNDFWGCTDYPGCKGTRDA